MSISNYSFKQWCVDNNRQDILDRWDYDKNNCNPSDIGYMSNNKYYFKCPEKKHDSQLFKICDLHKSQYPLLKCKKCNSFAQVIIDKYGEEYLKNIWSDKNTKSPWDVSTKTNKHYYLICQNNNEHIYPISLNHFLSGTRCSYCSNHKIMKSNSLGTVYPEAIKVWSDKNIKSPYEFAPNSSVDVWWKCNNNIHEDYLRSIADSKTRKYICPECGKKQGYITRRENLTNKKFGELTALYIDEEKTSDKERVYWVCKCSCGAKCSVSTTNLKTGNSTTCGNRSIHYSGENNGNWQGGKTAPLQVERTSLKYNTWRDSVYKKDWYTCQCCGRSKNINKNAHHIHNFLDNEDLRYDIDNGILLCDECHAFICPNSFHHIYGTRNNTPEQLEEYINNRRKELNINKPFKIVNYLNGDILKPNTVCRIGE